MSTSIRCFEEAISAMTVQGSPVSSQYVFYMHMISQCRVVFDEKLPVPAAIHFDYDHYVLTINPLEKILKESSEITEGDVKQSSIPGFGGFSLLHRVGVLKHEMLHIVFKHPFRSKQLQKRYGNEYKHKIFGIAADCALNQQINRKHLPEKAVYPDTLSIVMKMEIPVGLTTEEYYEILHKACKNDKDKQKALSNFFSLDDHNSWDKSRGDEIIASGMVKRIISKAFEATQKSRGDTPSTYSSWLEMLTRKAQVDWKKMLRHIIGNKRVNAKPTFFRPNRRNPEASYLKGKIKDRIYDLLVVADVSGSVSNEELMYGLNEIHQICKMTSSTVKLIQVDTEACSPEDITKNTKRIDRKACGGTILRPALKKAKERHLIYDAIVVITDGQIDDEDIQAFEATGKKVVWVITSNVDLGLFKRDRMIGTYLRIEENKHIKNT